MFVLSVNVCFPQVSEMYALVLLLLEDDEILPLINQFPCFCYKAAEKVHCVGICSGLPKFPFLDGAPYSSKLDRLDLQTILLWLIVRNHIDNSSVTLNSLCVCVPAVHEVCCPAQLVFAVAIRRRIAILSWCYCQPSQTSK